LVEGGGSIERQPAILDTAFFLPPKMFSAAIKSLAPAALRLAVRAASGATRDPCRASEPGL
jgi:hypothetical protein